MLTEAVCFGQDPVQVLADSHWLPFVDHNVSLFSHKSQPIDDQITGPANQDRGQLQEREGSLTIGPRLVLPISNIFLAQNLRLISAGCKWNGERLS